MASASFSAMQNQREQYEEFDRSYTSVHLRLNDFADLIVDTRQYHNVSLNPGGVCNDGDFDGREEVLTEVTTLRVIPSKPFVLERHEMV